MNDQHFFLQPFPTPAQKQATAVALGDLKITGNIVRHSNTLTLRYQILGPIAALVLPAPADHPVRKNELWEETCFEFFLGVKNSERYWEFNLSPAGHWNVYRFDAYRQGMQAEMAFRSLPFRIQSQSNSLSLALQLNLDQIVRAQILEVAISTVIKHMDGKVSYWALTHPGPQADFHQRDSFIVKL